MQDLYLFNPDNEISIANGTNGYTPKANISIMAGDLAFLSAYLTGKGKLRSVPISRGGRMIIRSFILSWINNG